MTPELLQLEMCVVIMMMLQCHNLGTTINNGTSNVTNTNAPQFDNYLPFLLFQIPTQRFEHHIHVFVPQLPARSIPIPEDQS